SSTRGPVSELGSEQDQIRKALVPLMLKMVLSGQQGVEAEFIHEHGEFFGHAKRLNEPFIGIAPRVRRGPVPAHVFQLNLAHVENRKMLDHEALSSLSAAHGNYPASLAGWVTTCLVCEQRFATRCVFTAHCTKKPG